MKFTLEITLGNAAMNTPDDIAWALSALASRLEGNDTSYDAMPPHDGTIMDINGNTVGRWVVASQ